MLPVILEVPQVVHISHYLEILFIVGDGMLHLLLWVIEPELNGVLLDIIPHLVRNMHRCSLPDDVLELSEGLRQGSPYLIELIQLQVKLKLSFLDGLSSARVESTCVSGGKGPKRLFGTLLAPKLLKLVLSINLSESWSHPSLSNF